MNTRNSFLAPLFVSLSLASAHASVISIFDIGDEDWRVADLIQPFNGQPQIASFLSPIFNPTGGNPGGAIQETDPSGNAFYFSAPSKFLGDQSSSLEGSLSWDLKMDLQASSSASALILSDGITALYYQDSGPSPINAWRTYTVNLIGSSFTVNSPTGLTASDSQLSVVLSNVEALYLRGDWNSGIETTQLDNVQLTTVPEPGTWLLLATGMVSLLGYGWRKPRTGFKTVLLSPS